MLGRPRTVGPDGPVLLERGETRRVCIVLLSGVGDVVHGLPLAWDLKSVDADIEVVWVAEPAPAQVLARHPAVDRVVVYRTPDGLRGVRDLRRALKGWSADLTLNVQRYFKSVWPTLFSGARRRVAMPPSKTRDGIQIFHTHALADGPWKHTQDIFLDFRWALGVKRNAPVRWELSITDAERDDQRAFLRQSGEEPRAGLVVGSANPKKDWPPGRYAELADRLAAEHGYRVLLLGGPSQREREAAADIARTASRPVVDCVGDGVRRLMWLIDACDLVVAPDTGPLHIAHALQVPVVGLYGHTNPWRVGPYRHFRDLVVDRYTEQGAEPDPSGYLPRDDRMDQITVEDVLEKVELARERYA